MWKNTRITVLVAVILVLQGCGAIRVPVLFTFDEPRELEVGAPVVYNNQPVGEVKSVDYPATGNMRVQTRISREMHQKMNRPCTALVEDNKLPEAKTKNCLTIYLVENAAALPESIMEVQGCDSRAELMLWKANQTAQQFLTDHEEEIEKVKQAARDAVRQIEEFAQSDDMKQFTQKLQDLSEETGKQARESYEELKQRWPDFAQRMEEIYKRMDELGRSEEAQRLRDSLTRLLSPKAIPEPTKEAEERRI
ncbi:MAG TPA: MlaD family protein [bacterium]|nr:MlaD family protein [bacterium]HQO36821.1 MlaD family protein [bacterium]HQP99306.1 MlaD family protein [bacterium]